MPRHRPRTAQWLLLGVAFLFRAKPGGAKKKRKEKGTLVVSGGQPL